MSGVHHGTVLGQLMFIVDHLGKQSPATPLVKAPLLAINNAEKFQALRYRVTNAPQLAFTGHGGAVIPESETARDLGICMCNDASFCVHINKLAANNRRMVRDGY